MTYAPITKLDKFIGEEDNTQIWLNDVAKAIIANNWDDASITGWSNKLTDSKGEQDCRRDSPYCQQLITIGIILCLMLALLEFNIRYQLVLFSHIYSNNLQMLQLYTLGKGQQVIFYPKMFGYLKIGKGKLTIRE
ncbi:hypothetical protein G9A89_023075 [Geosiphon pyriformis]|nr:hypothetical protein G9A89_023075 [Geosiphon pyriformis]